MTSTASSVGTLVNSEVTSKLTRASSASTRSSFTTPVKCLEFRTCEVVLPARGEITDAMYLESLYEGAPMHETMGLSGVCMRNLEECPAAQRQHEEGAPEGLEGAQEPGG